MHIFISRIKYSDKQTLGEGVVFDDDKSIFEFGTLELPWKENKHQISCIPEGVYTIKKRNSSKYGDHFIVEDVPNRSYILIHNGNYYTQTEGCILVGKKKHIDIDGDSLKDVTNSVETLKKLNELLPKESTLEIRRAIIIEK